MRINTNVSSLTAQEASQNTSKRITSSLEKLSTGLRINKASDDASGLAIADKLRTQATSINQGITNGNSAVALLQIADKSMAEQSNILDTIKSKLIQANTDTTSADGREAIRKDISKLLEQLDNIAKQTNYNGNVLLQKSSSDASASNKLSFQVGETNNDIIRNSSIQSNSEGLGSEKVYSSETGNDTVDVGTTVKVASGGAITLNSTNSIDNNVAENVTLSGDVDSLTLKEGMTISNVDAATKAILDAAKDAGNLTESGGTYTVSSAGEGKSLNLSSVNNVSMTVSTPAESVTVPAQDLTVTIGDVVDTFGGTTNIGSALESALADTSKFADMGDGKFKALTGQTIALEQGESVTHLDSLKVDIGAGGTVTAGSSITLNSDMIALSDLENQLSNASKFTLTSGTAGKEGAVYTVLADFTADNLKLVGDESITISAAANITSPTVSAAGMIDDATLTFTPKGGTAVNLDWDTVDSQITAQGQAEGAGGATAQISQEGVLNFKVTAVAATNTFNALAGDTVSITNDGDATNAMIASILESNNWIDNGDNTYTAIANQTITFDDVGDILDVKRTIGSNLTTKEYGPNGADGTVPAAAVVSRDATGVTAEKVSVTFTTSSSVDVKNNDTANSLKISGDGTNVVTNGGTQLKAMAELKAGELTKDLSASFETVIDDAITDLNGYRGDIGSTQNQVESAVRNLMTQATNVKAAESIIRDVDYAAESANFNKQNIISQAGSYAISQANAVQQNVLRLLQ